MIGCGSDADSVSEPVTDTTSTEVTVQEPKEEINLQENEYEVLETLTISCDGPAGSSFYLLTGAESFDIIQTKKLTCTNPVQVLERVCVQNEGSYKGDLFEMDKVKQSDLIGWAQRKDLVCKDLYCENAKDSICENEKNKAK